MAIGRRVGSSSGKFDFLGFIDLLKMISPHVTKVSSIRNILLAV